MEIKAIGLDELPDTGKECRTRGCTKGTVTLKDIYCAECKAERLLVRGNITTVEINKGDRGIVKHFLMPFILALLLKNRLTGYDILLQIHRVFGVSFSSGTIYPILYELKDTGILEAVCSRTARYKKYYRVVDKEAVVKFLSQFRRINDKLWGAIDGDK